MRLFLLICLSLHVTLAQAIDTEAARMGLPPSIASKYQSLECPASSENLKDFRNKLMSLKAAIKKEANCGGVNQSIDGLADLVTKDRETFLNLITKGQMEGLSDQEQKTISNYITQLTVKTSTLLTILSGQDACFDEDKKGLSTEFLVSLLGEGSKVLSVLGGPEIGGIVSLAGSVITGFANASKIISDSAQGYDFSVMKEKIAYADSLCALFDYRRELDNLIFPYDTAQRITKLAASIDSQLRFLKRNCSECAVLIDQADIQTNQVTRNGLDPIQAVEDVWTDLFDKRMEIKSQEIDKLYTTDVGTQTYRALRMKTWLPLRQQAVESSGITADLGLLDVIGEMDNIERFMVDSQARRFLKQLFRDAKDWKSKIIDLVYNQGFDLAARYDDGHGYDTTLALTQYEMIGGVLRNIDGIANRSTDPRAKSELRAFLSNYRLIVQGFNVSVDVVDRYCTFFQNSNWYRNGIVDWCPNPDLDKLQDDTVLFANFQLMSTYKPGTTVVPKVSQSNVTISPDWMDSLSLTLREVVKKPGSVVREVKQP